VIFDHLWLDEILQTVIPEIPSHALLLRQSELAVAKVARPDYAAGAVVALRHMVECGYEEVQLAIPFANDPSTNQYIRAFMEHFAIAGGRMRWRKPWDCATAPERTALVQNLRRSRRRIALLIPEDNIAILLHQELEAHGVNLPGSIGIISLQGTAGPSSPLTRIRYDYRRLGRMAAGQLIGAPQNMQPFPPALITSRTTSAKALL
jgi:DNA-binding LacI/PurR family transcriptional regulator